MREPRTIAAHLPPLNDIEEIFEVAVRKALDQGLEAPLKYLAGRSLRVATMCSGTESPILALGLISKGEFRSFFLPGIGNESSILSCLQHYKRIMAQL